MADNTKTNSDDNGGSTKSEASAISLKDDVKGLGAEAKAIATDVVDEAKKLATARLDSGKGVVAEGIGTVAGALRSSSIAGSSGDRPQGSPTSAISGYLGSAADMIEGTSRYLENKSVGEVVGDVEDFARREPLIFLGGTFAVGLMLGRFLKASAPGTANAGRDDRTGQLTAPRPKDASSGGAAEPRGQRPARSSDVAGLDRLAPSAPTSLGQASAPSTGAGPARITSLGANTSISSPSPTTPQPAETKPTGGSAKAGEADAKKPHV